MVDLSLVDHKIFNIECAGRVRLSSWGVGGLPYGTDGDARGNPKGDHLGMAQAFCDRCGRPIWPWLKQILTPKRDCLKTDKYENKTNIKENLTYVSLCVILCFLVA